VIAELEFTVDIGPTMAMLDATNVAVLAEVDATVRMYGMLLQTTVQRRASNPRGGGVHPWLVTGDYVRSWNTRLVVEGGMRRAVVGTNRPQAMRLEFGFTGVDSLGRRYHQPPYPHARPALDEVGPKFQEAVRDVMHRAIMTNASRPL